MAQYSEKEKQPVLLALILSEGKFNQDVVLKHIKFYPYFPLKL